MPKVRLFKPWVGKEEISNIKKTFKHFPQNFNSFNSKILVYLGLIAYWGVILVGTFFHIN